MRKIKFNIVILVIVCNVFAQEQVVNKTEELNITEIELRAMEDAKLDFGSIDKLVWGSSSILISWGWFSIVEDVLHLDGIFPIVLGMGIPPALVLYWPSKLAEHRKTTVSIRTTEYQSIYLSKYKSTIRKQRVKYSILGPLSCLGTALITGAVIMLIGT